MSYKNRESCAKKLKLSFEDVKNTFESHNCILLSSEDDYVNESSKLKYICVCGNTHTKIFRDYKHKDWRCPSCVKKELAKTNAIKNGYGFDNINELFKNHGFVLETIKEYYNQKDRITYHCENHHKNTKLLSTYKKNPICIECNKELVLNECDKLIKEKFDCNEIMIKLFNGIIEEDIDEDDKHKLLEKLGKKIYKFNKYQESNDKLKVYVKSLLDLFK